MMTPDVLTDTAEQALLADLASQVEPGHAIVELGVFRGGSLAVLDSHARRGVEVYGVDLFGADGTPDYYKQGSGWIKWWEWFAGRPHDWSTNYQVARAAAPGATLIVADTVSTGETWAGEPISLLYIDADHSYEGVKADWTAWSPHLAPGATVVFDDYRFRVRRKDHYPGVTRLVDELGLEVRRVGKAGVVKP